MSTAAVDDRRSADDVASCGSRYVHRLARGAAGGDNIFDHEHFVIRNKRESAAQHERAALPLREDGAHAERARDLVADHDAAERRRHDDVRAQRTDALGQRAAEGFGLVWVLQHQRGLHIAGAVQTG